MNKALLVAVIVVALAALAGGLSVVGGPAYARLEKQDLDRAKDIRQIHNFLRCRNGEEVLPQTLEDREYCPGFGRAFDKSDAVTGAPYIYRRLSDSQFEVCATFVTQAHLNKGNNRYRDFEFDGQVGCRKGIRVMRTSAFKPMDQFVVTAID